MSFDCYGTLIDWESGIFEGLKPLLCEAGANPSRDDVLACFARHEAQLEAAYPRLLYPELLAAVYGRIAAHYSAAGSGADRERFGRSVGGWPPFPDSTEALRYLKNHYELVVLSNVDRESFRRSNERLGVRFDAVYTAQDIGSYKPSLENFRYLIERLARRGHSQERILHVAQSLFHDHAPAQQLGLATAWIDRRRGFACWGATMPPAEAVRYDFRFGGVAELVSAHQNERQE